MVVLDCVIRNQKNVFIRLNENGTPVACSDRDKTLFKESKAKNILSSLPKTLRKLNFKVEMLPDIKIKDEQIIQKEEYNIPEEVNRWIEKFGICDDVIQEARNRKEELVSALSNIDKELSNTLHKIELERSKNACEGFKEYKELKAILEKRRTIKDELMIISNVLNMDFRNFNAEMVNRAIVGLAKRKFSVRFVEEDE